MSGKLKYGCGIETMVICEPQIILEVPGLEANQ